MILNQIFLTNMILSCSIGTNLAFHLIFQTRRRWGNHARPSQCTLTSLVEKYVCFRGYGVLSGRFSHVRIIEIVPEHRVDID